MPRALAGPCSYPGCPYRADTCPKHRRPRRFDERHYWSPAWRQARQEQLEREPFCREHRKQGVIVKATQVNHIKPRKRGGTDDPSNLESLCGPCHAKATFAGR